LKQQDFTRRAIATQEATMDGEGGPAVVACSLRPGDLSGRAARWRALTARALLQASRTEGGLRLVFRALPEVAGELSALAALERECCPFAAWSVHQSEGELTLEVSGQGAQAIAAVQSLFCALA
jgi:hypothetical protein